MKAMQDAESLPVEVLAHDLGISVGKLDAYLVNGQLVASFFSSAAVLLYEVNLECYDGMDWVVSSRSEPEYREKGFYDIIAYREITWTYNKDNNTTFADLNTLNIFLHKDDKYYSTACTYILNKDDVIITKQNLNAFLLKTSNTVFVDQVLTGNPPQEPVIEIGQQDRTKECTRRISPPSVKGRRGFLKALILDGLQDFNETKKNMPEEGKAFQDFLIFIYTRLNSDPRPQYLAQVAKVVKTGKLDEKCICEDKPKSVKKWYTRRYVEKQFYEYRKTVLAVSPAYK